MTGRYTVGTCRVCSRTMVSEHVWRKGIVGLSDTYSHSLRQRLCAACRIREIRENLPPGVKASKRRRSRKAINAEIDEMLDEYALIRSDCGSIEQAAERLGLKSVTLEQRLYRARRRGDSRGNPPVGQLLRAAHRGAPFDRRHPHGHLRQSAA